MLIVSFLVISLTQGYNLNCCLNVRPTNFFNITGSSSNKILIRKTTTTTNDSDDAYDKDYKIDRVGGGTDHDYGGDGDDEDNYDDDVNYLRAFIKKRGEGGS